MPPGPLVALVGDVKPPRVRRSAMAALVAALLCLLLASAEAEVGSRCSNDRECSRTVNHSECRDGKCQCRERLVPTVDKMRCLHGVGLNYACEDHGQCIDPHTSCRNEGRHVMCVCSHGYVLHNKTCLPEVLLRRPCQVSKQCTMNAECEGGICLCAGFALENGDRCVLDETDDVDTSRAVRGTFHLGLVFMLIGRSFL